MKKSILATIFFIFISSNAMAKRSIEVSVDLTPAGDFVAKSGMTIGKLHKSKDGGIESDKISVKVERFDTGIELRNEHFRKYLSNNGKNDKVTVTNIKGNNGKGTGSINVRGIEKPFSFTYKDIGSGDYEANFELKSSDFGITGVSYAGIGVKDKVEVKVILPIEVGAKK